jgi:hypothetical protein
MISIIWYLVLVYYSLDVLKKYKEKFIFHFSMIQFF